LLRAKFEISVIFFFTDWRQNAQLLTHLRWSRMEQNNIKFVYQFSPQLFARWNEELTTQCKNKKAITLKDRPDYGLGSSPRTVVYCVCFHGDQLAPGLIKLKDEI
jgi:hypothetical protein